MSFLTFRRYYLDTLLERQVFRGKVLDVGGHKTKKRGRCEPDIKLVTDWHYLNIDESTNPDFCCSADNIPVEDEEYDYVILCEVIEHLENPENVLVECSRVLAPGGKIIISAPFIFPIHAHPDDFQRWLPSKYLKVLESIKFENIKVQAMGGLIPAIWDIFRFQFMNGVGGTYPILGRILVKLMKFTIPLVFLSEKIFHSSRFISGGYFVTAEKIFDSSSEIA